MRASHLLLFTGIVAAPAAADTISITIPAQKVAEYHRPFVAVWIEPAAGGVSKTLAVWYAVRRPNGEPGTKWLADLRSWWRKGGRSLTMPADGISGATRAPGQYRIPLPADLAPGAYMLHVEAARESGGRELVSVPLNVPRASGRATGSTELGAVTIKPN